MFRIQVKFSNIMKFVRRVPIDIDLNEVFVLMNKFHEQKVAMDQCALNYEAAFTRKCVMFQRRVKLEEELNQLNQPSTKKQRKA